jgi:tetratricopeptide (TPR) repeat protein
MMRPGFVIAVLLLPVFAMGQSARTSSLEEVFEGANVAASRGDYPRAISGYRTLIEAGVRDADVYFNLATTFAQSGDYPQAILNYERALIERPNDEQAEEDLRKAEQSLEEQRAEREGEAMIQRRSSMSEAVYGSFSEDALAYLLIVANVLFFACLGWIWIARRRSGRLVFASVAAGFVLLFSAFGLAVKAGMLRDGPRAVALEERVALREGPDDNARVRGEARGGDRAQVVATDRGFVKLRVVSGLEGWAPVSSVGIIDLDERVH